jgi:hypothetical protein
MTGFNLAHKNGSRPHQSWNFQEFTGTSPERSGALLWMHVLPPVPIPFMIRSLLKNRKAAVVREGKSIRSKLESPAN